MESTETKSRKNNKSKGKRWLLLCFKPTILDKSFEEASRKNRAGPVLTYDAGFPTRLSSALSTENCSREACSCNGRLKKNDHHGSFWQALRTALNDTSLAKKITKNKTAKQTLCRTSREFAIAAKISSAKLGDSLQRERFFDCEKTQQTNSNASSSCCSSAFTSSSSCSSSSTLSSNTPGSNSSEMSRSSSTSLSANANIGVTNFKRENGVKESAQAQGRSDTNEGLFLLMFSLVVLILCGKFCAILCTSIWLFIVPRRSLQSNQPANLEKSKLDSVQYKKKVIMEGLLERRRNRVNTASVAKPQG